MGLCDASWFVFIYRLCLKMSVVLGPGTGGGVSFQDTASLIGPTLMMKNGRYCYEVFFKDCSSFTTTASLDSYGFISLIKQKKKMLSKNEHQNSPLHATKLSSQYIKPVYNLSLL